MEKIVNKLLKISINKLFLSRRKQLLFGSKLRDDNRANRVDTLSGVSGTDILVLGEKGQNYYSAAKTSDYGLIVNLNQAEVTIQLSCQCK